MSDTTTSEANVSQLPAKSAFKRLAQCKNLQEAFQTKEFRDRIAQAIPKAMNPDSMLRTFIQAATKQPLIFKCDLRQTLGAYLSLAYLGLEPGTIQQHAHMIPFARRRWNPKTRERELVGYDLVVVIGYPGYVELALRSGFVRDIATGIVLPGDEFDWERGSNRFLKHRPNLEAWNATAQPRAVWAMAKLVNEGEEFEVMSWAEVLTIRNRTQAYRAALAAKEAAEREGRRLPDTWTEAPWVAHERQMGRKTALRRLATLLPKCPEVRAGLAMEDVHDAGKKVDFGPVIDGIATPLDGLPEMNETEDDPPPNSAAAKSPTNSDNSDNRQKSARKPTPTNPDKSRQSAAKPVPKFEAVLVDAEQEPISEHNTPIGFADAVVQLWEETGDERVREYNIDAIEEARRLDPAAANKLAALDEQTGGDSDDPGDSNGDDPPSMPKGPSQEDRDRQWFEDRKAEIAKMPKTTAGRHQFEALLRNAMVRTVMERLSRENADLYAQVRTYLAAAADQFPKPTPPEPPLAA